jgi:hypothetical protein
MGKEGGGKFYYKLNDWGIVELYNYGPSRIISLLQLKWNNVCIEDYVTMLG